MRAQEQARRRLAFDELFTLQLAVLRQRHLWRKEPARELHADPATLEKLIDALPYTLTGAQQRAVTAVVKDMAQPVAMHRLLQGDVGSGKTVVAALGMALAASIGAQSALMAPTEILAEQHFKTISKLFDAFNEKAGLPAFKIALLTGSVKAGEKRAIYEGITDGSIHVVIGTHALIQEGVIFQNLGFVVVDEQHRFGVMQRTALRQKGRPQPAHAGDDRHAHPAHAGADPVRRPGHHDSGRDAAWPAADRHALVLRRRSASAPIASCSIRSMRAGRRSSSARWSKRARRSRRRRRWKSTSACSAKSSRR